MSSGEDSSDVENSATTSTYGDSTAESYETARATLLSSVSSRNSDTSSEMAVVTEDEQENTYTVAGEIIITIREAPLEEQWLYLLTETYFEDGSNINNDQQEAEAYLNTVFFVCQMVALFCFFLQNPDNRNRN